MKVRKPRIDGLSQTRFRKRPWIGPEDECHKLYWTHALDFLFAVQVSRSGQLVYESINPAFEGLLGISSEDICGNAVSDCVSDEDAKAICASCEACFTEAKAIRDEHRLAFGGRRRNFETVVTPIRDPENGRIIRVIGSHRALKEGRGAVERTATKRAAANLEVRLLSLQEEVQQRIASDLHDSTCQHLIAVSLNIMRMRREINGSCSAERLCDELDGSIDQALREIRAFTYLLHPKNLLADGLKTTIEQFVDGFATRTSLKADLKITPEVDRLPYERQCSVLRIIQEALANVFRHAKATRVTIAMEAKGTHFKLRIRDDGLGMPIGQARSGPEAISFGVGIPAMRARLHQLGGALEIRSSSAGKYRGTTLCAVIPQSLPRKRTRLPERGHRELEHHKSIAGQH